MAKVPVLIFGNKQDVYTARNPVQVKEEIFQRSSAVLSGRKWYVQGCSGQTGDGLTEGLKWLSKAVKKKKK